MSRHNSTLNHINKIYDNLLFSKQLMNSELEKSLSMNLGLEKSFLMNSGLEKSLLMNSELEKSLLMNSELEKSLSMNSGLEKSFLMNSGLEKSFSMNSVLGNQFRNIINLNQIYNELLFLNRVINLDKIVLDSILDNTISKNNNTKEIDRENLRTTLIKIREYFIHFKKIGKNIVTILSSISVFLSNFKSNNEGNNITYNTYNYNINNYCTDSYLTNLIGFTNKDTMLYSRSNESLEEITPLYSGLKVKIIDKYNEWIQIEVNPDGIILKGWVRSDDINILK